MSYMNVVLLQLCKGTFRSAPSYVMQDNCCLCHTAALKAVTGLSEENITYITFHNKIYEVSFFQANLAQLCILKWNIQSWLHILEVNFYPPQVPFFVAIDDETQHVVLAIRGTLSLHDAITDLNAQCTSVSTFSISVTLFDEVVGLR